MAGKAFGVSASSVDRAKRVMAADVANGSDYATQVKAGTLNLGAADAMVTPQKPKKERPRTTSRSRSGWRSCRGFWRV